MGESSPKAVFYDLATAIKGFEIDDQSSFFLVPERVKLAKENSGNINVKMSYFSSQNPRIIIELELVTGWSDELEDKIFELTQSLQFIPLKTSMIEGLSFAPSSPGLEIITLFEDRETVLNVMGLGEIVRVKIQGDALREIGCALRSGSTTDQLLQHNPVRKLRGELVQTYEVHDGAAWTGGTADNPGEGVVKKELKIRLPISNISKNQEIDIKFIRLIRSHNIPC